MYECQGVDEIFLIVVYDVGVFIRDEVLASVDEIERKSGVVLEILRMVARKTWCRDGRS